VNATLGEIQPIENDQVFRYIAVCADAKIDSSTARCIWLGERMDYSTAIESMQFREEAARAPTPAPS